MTTPDTTRLERRFQESVKKRNMAPWFGFYLIVLCLGLWVGLFEVLEPETRILTLVIFLTGQTLLAMIRLVMVSSLVKKLDQALAAK